MRSLLFLFIIVFSSVLKANEINKENKNDAINKTQDQKIENRLKDMSLKDRWLNIFNKDTEFNPAFRGKKHLLEIGFGGAFEAYAFNNYNQERVWSNNGIWNLHGRYSIPVHLFFQGRTSIEIGSILGNFTNGNINQIYGSLTHEFIFDFKYFYTTIGGGFAYRNIRGGVGKDYNVFDGIGSRLVATVRIGVGFPIKDNINIEIFFKHFSNGHLQEPNRGYNFIGTSIGFLL